MKLKYLFGAVFEDGSSIGQTADDKSETEPLRSAFYDVLERAKETPLELFGLLSGDGHDSWLVNLKDGHFEVGGIPFMMHSEPVSNFRVVFFRRHFHDINIEVATGNSREFSHTVEYHLGWQGNDKDGKNIQRTLHFT